ncbi:MULTISPECIES: hypothetical protein [unclassified Rathayibacter]|jgi:hypothetical protein|uniref:HAAS signaling domain-containing protein n=1 Tax=unclassified Rathayibacter TaxID=2609250 RepID=UPI000CE830A7|nr:MULTISPECIES: hypothetical protein [unclassified Rathayibacter]PPF28440.1 hypothetical protein C5C54_06925 [Rathayibacter sp. AY1F2]PPG18124.1 hypothetical protein C5D36_02410 [Rathayibacter sp. AY1C6]PPG60484.1 hypothetical protein C5C69_08835 [Rathayibacter sp. AY1C7]PPH41958.1 hypothetical protein C5C86_06000 [Rathayibacter sp. AY1E4]PPH48350.1 hypothetical protein C5C42_01970 [Rathayibacter sp. AY1F7]
MSTTTSPAAARYLEELRIALSGVPADLRSEIWSGIGEELDGLDDDAARERIAELGSPSRIAQAAGGSLAGGGGSIFDRPWFAVVASLVFAFGWLVIPGFGWLLGAVAILLCSSWTVSEKRGALVIPVVAAVVVGGAIGLYYWLSAMPSSGMTTWTVLAGAWLVGGGTSLVLGTRLCARFVRTRRAHSALE